jgi:formylglycine-generating enzyme required for sulfatase activity
MKQVCYVALVLSLLLATPALAQEPDPNAAIQWPASVYVLRGAVEIRGTANLSDMAGYFVEYVLLPENTFVPADDALWFPATLPAPGPVLDGVLGVWDTLMVPDGLYALRLTVNVPGGAVHHVVSPVRVENNPPSFVQVVEPPPPPPAVSEIPEPLPVGFPNANWVPVEREIAGMPFVYVPAGCFMMGQDSGDEQPVHEVCLDAFWIGKTEVTNAQYTACIDYGGCSSYPEFVSSNDRDVYFDDPTFGNYPVVYVTWYQAQEYAAWLGGALPTEAQWEYAARGPESWTYPWGEDEPSSARLNYDNAVSDTSLVSAYPTGASWVGALDMAGNVVEWTNSLYRDYPYDAGDGRELVDPSIDADRVQRSSAFFDDGYLWSSKRWSSRPDRSDDTVGFRVIVTDIEALARLFAPSPEN